ncbi:MAG: peptidase domain-containing ABC transporter [Burkholderiales bacterium]|nr:peptidase domain-containing ABC transporter [Burkholderiales bacterium]
MSALRLAITPESFLWSLESISRELRLPFSRALARRSFPPPYDLSSLQRAAHDMGARTELVALSWEELGQNPSAWWVLIRDPAPEDAAADPRPAGGAAHRFVRIAAVEKERVMLAEAAAAEATALPLQRFVQVYTGYALRTVAGKPRHDDSEPDAGGMPKFGLRWFARELLRYRSIWRDVVLASIAIQLLALAVPVLTQIIIDKVITHRTLNTLVVVGAALVVIAAFSAALAWVRQYLILHTGTRIDAVLAGDVFEHLLRLPARYFEQRSTGVLVARMHGVETIREFITGATLTLLLDLPFMCLFAAVMFYYSPVLTAIALGMLGVLACLSLAVTPVLRGRIDAQFLAGARHQAFVTERVAAIETVKSLQMEPALTRRFETLLGRYLEAGLGARQLANSFQAGAQLLEQLLAVAVLCVGAWLVIEGAGLTIGGLIAFQMFATRLTGPMLKIASLWQEFQQVHIAVRRLADIMDVPRELWRLNPARTASGHGALECKDLGFRYPGRGWLLRHLSFSLRPGECVALIGPSGSGKSTLARLLLGFQPPSEGAIMLDGVDTAHLAANELRSYFGVVPQETRLFTGTVLDNLLDADPSASLADAAQACRSAQLHDLIQTLPEGYLTRIGENGIGLSGGQKQRLAIARALLKQPRVLVFDEVTSSLDPQLSAAIAQTVNGLRGKVSVLFVAHALPPGLSCDSVVTIGAAEGWS